MWRYVTPKCFCSIILSACPARLTTDVLSRRMNCVWRSYQSRTLRSNVFLAHVRPLCCCVSAFSRLCWCVMLTRSCYLSRSLWIARTVFVWLYSGRVHFERGYLGPVAFVYRCNMLSRLIFGLPGTSQFFGNCSFSGASIFVTVVSQPFYAVQWSESWIIFLGSAVK